MTLPPSLQAVTDSQPAQFKFISTGLCGLVVSIIIGMLFACWLLPNGFVAGTYPYWLAQNEDVTVYVSGFNAFFREPWQWPLWRIDSLNWPGGTLTTFVDAIPIYAAALKLLAPASWFPFNPYGYWVAGCIVLQSTGAWWVLREARVKSWIGLLTLALLLMSFPAWLARMGHISLMSQWLLVFAIALTVRSSRRQNFSGLGWCALLWFAFFTNIYVFAMCALVCACDALRCLRKGKRRSVFTWASLTVATVAASAFATMWPIPGSTGAPDVGFGIYSMNLLSPFTGSRFFELTAHSGEQAFEGYNYLGLGGLALIVIALWLRVRRPQKNTTSGFPAELWIVLVVCTLYALSNAVYAGNTLLWAWEVPEWAKPITGQLRASGRFFWLVGYALIVFSVIAITQRLPRLIAVMILIGATTLQAIDLWPQMHQLRTLAPKPGAQVIEIDAWDQALPDHTQTIYFFPKFKCGRKTDLFVTLLPVMRYASERGLNINTGYIARHNPVCEGEAEEIAASNPTNSVYVFATQEYEQALIHSMFPSAWPMKCNTQDFATICHRTEPTVPDDVRNEVLVR